MPHSAPVWRRAAGAPSPAPGRGLGEGQAAGRSGSGCGSPGREGPRSVSRRVLGPRQELTGEAGPAAGPLSLDSHPSRPETDPNTAPVAQAAGGPASRGGPSKGRGVPCPSWSPLPTPERRAPFPAHADITQRPPLPPSRFGSSCRFVGIGFLPSPAFLNPVKEEAGSPGRRVFLSLRPS